MTALKGNFQDEPPQTGELLILKRNFPLWKEKSLHNLKKGMIFIVKETCNDKKFILATLINVSTNIMYETYTLIEFERLDCGHGNR